MNKALVRILILGLIVATAGSSVGRGEKPETEEIIDAPVATQENPPSLEVISSSGNYVVQVDYEDFNSWRGHGKAYYTIKNKDGEVLDKFSSEISPLEVFVSNQGNIVAFGGDRTEKIFIDKICFYDVKGNLLKTHIVNITIPGGQVISDDGKYFVLGYQYGGRKSLSLLNVETGEKMWELSLDVRPDEVMISNNGKWIVAVGSLKSEWGNGKILFVVEKIILFDSSGKKHWERIEKLLPGKTLGLNYINEEGTLFNIREIEFRFDRQKNVREEFITKEIIYKNAEGRVEIEKIIDKEEQLPVKK
jgi:hypothetical protein